MKRKIFVIRSKEVINRLVAFLEAQPDKPMLEVAVYDHKQDRSAEQNRYYWQILTIISDELGLSKNETHNLFKKRFLVKIFERDHEGYSSMVNAVRKVHTKGFKQDAKIMSDQIIRLTSTAAATTKQFSEYLNDILHHAANNGIVLPHPEDKNIFCENRNE